MSESSPSYEWYELDSGAVVARSNGVPGIFLLAAGASNWTWYGHGSDGWDAVDQAIFRQCRADRLSGPPPGAPPLPPPGVAETRDRDDPGRFLRDPKLLAWAGDAGRNACLVLMEDTYETFMGDGLFRYMVGCFPSEADAAGAPAPESDMIKHSNRMIHLRDVGGRLEARGERLNYADRYEMEEVLADLVKRLE